MGDDAQAAQGAPGWVLVRPTGSDQPLQEGSLDEVHPNPLWEGK